MPIYLPIDTLGRAGYDNDWEWRTYDYGRRPPNGFFKVKFELVNPDRPSFGDLVGDVIGAIGGGWKSGGGEGPTTKPGIVPP
jgi:hypothetical protein